MSAVLPALFLASTSAPAATSAAIAAAWPPCAARMSAVIPSSSLASTATSSLRPSSALSGAISPAAAAALSALTNASGAWSAASGASLPIADESTSRSSMHIFAPLTAPLASVLSASAPTPSSTSFRMRTCGAAGAQ